MKKLPLLCQKTPSFLLIIFLGLLCVGSLNHLVAKQYNSKYRVSLSDDGNALLTEHIQFDTPTKQIEIKVAKNADTNTLLVNTKGANVAHYSLNGTQLKIVFSQPVDECVVIYRALLPWHIIYKGILSESMDKIDIEARIVLKNQTGINFIDSHFSLDCAKSKKIPLQEDLTLHDGQVLNVLLVKSATAIDIEQRVFIDRTMLEENIRCPQTIATSTWGIINVSTLQNLPKGKITLYQLEGKPEGGASPNLLLLGESQLSAGEHGLERSFNIPSNEPSENNAKINVTIEQTEFKKLRQNKFESAYYIVLNSEKETPEIIRAIINFDTPNWKLIRQSIDPIEKSEYRLSWLLRVQKGRPTSYRYRLQYTQDK